ncbi:hypothetical protein BGW38_010708 [Lunasporangiospora selenospora]|uniref:Uncharacterized protein n=1 Tax=Lunasporangiospora selenospora TaxID=979761 RepID=A0A9P6G2P4_9FUNG|nr:hypothetical protein BGW38_010708 [Lunasporangiospora selenospora]
MTRLARILEVQNCRVLLTFSQRTADNTRQAVSKLQERIQDPDRLFVYDPMTVKKGSSTPNDQDSTMSNTNSELSAPGPKDLLGFRRGNNPYEAMLALADKIVVTADSVAMTSEALAAGKPVYILGGGLARGKLKVFHRYLADAHYTRAFRPGRIPIEQEERDTGADSSENGMETSDPLSYPGNLLPWNRSLAGQSPAETMKLVERLQILREARVTGHRAPEHITNATC